MPTGHETSLGPQRTVRLSTDSSNMAEQCQRVRGDISSHRQAGRHPLAGGQVAYALQAQDRVLMSFPEVVQIHGKAGRAETSADPAPLSMMETAFARRIRWIAVMCLRASRARCALLRSRRPCRG
jgi:hypothetical protein